MQTLIEKERASPRKQALAEAVRAFLRALGREEEGELEGTPERVAQLWDEVLVPTTRQPPSKTLATADAISTDVLFGPINFHLICPHHLTIAQGVAEIAYSPGSSILGLGEIAQVVGHMASDLLLQETLGQRIANALIQAYDVRAAWVRLSARHACGSLSMPQTHGASLVTLSVAGESALVARLRAFAEAKGSGTP